ncbi:MAG: hypothetical protein WC976_05910 [Caldisericia bacterium]
MKQQVLPYDIIISLDKIGIQIHADKGWPICKDILHDIGTKQEFYKEQRYFHAIEREAVYLNESTKAIIRAIANYLLIGKPNEYSESGIEYFVCCTRVATAKTVTPYHLRFLYCGCQGCLVHSEHSEYQDWKLVRDYSMEAYARGLEVWYTEIMSANSVAQLYLKTVLRRRDSFAGSCENVLLETILETVKMRIDYFGLACIGKIDIPYYSATDCPF